MDINGQKSREMIMTLSEVAGYLKIAQKTVHRMIQRNDIPAAKVGKQWRFYRPIIDDWIVSKMSPRGMDRKLPDTVAVGQLVRLERILVDLPGNSKESILENLMAPLVEDGLIGRRRYLELLLDRERMLSTAVGKGVAFPHIRHTEHNPGGGPYLVIGTNKTGTDFDSPDGEPVRLFALFVARDESDHLRGIAAMANLFERTEVVDRIVLSTSAESILSIIKKEEGR